MTEPQPPTITEGATTGDIADTVADPALSTSNSAEDRKAAAALDALDDRRDVEAGQGKHVDQEAVKKAMDRLAGMQEKPAVKKGEGRKEEVKKKAVKVDDAVVNLLVGDDEWMVGKYWNANRIRSISWT